MKAKIWISTHRRKEMLQLCLAGVKEAGIPVTVLHSNDEDHDIPDWVNVVRLPVEASGVGTGAPREIAGKMAIDEWDDALIFMDDDVICGDEGRTLKLLIEALEDDDELGAVTSRDNWHHTKKEYKGELRLMDTLICCTAIRMSAYIETGGIDSRLARLEDRDLFLRLRICGWKAASHGLVEVEHKLHRPGGLTAKEKGLDSDAHQASKIGSVEPTKLALSKFPPGTVRPTYKVNRTDAKSTIGLTFRSRRYMERLQRDYQEGLLEVSVKGVRYKED